MTTFILILIALLVIAALERTNRRQVAHPHGLNGSADHDDRDWARIKVDLFALDDNEANVNNRNRPRAA